MTQIDPLADAARWWDQIVTIEPGVGVADIAKIMRANRVGCLVVVDTLGQMVGIVTERDVLDWVGDGAPQICSTQAGDIMTTNVISCTEDTSFEQARELMVEHGIRHVPVVEDGMPMGMISSRDVMAMTMHK